MESVNKYSIISREIHKMYDHINMCLCVQTIVYKRLFEQQEVLLYLFTTLMSRTEASLALIIEDNKIYILRTCKVIKSLDNCYLTRY